MAGSGRPRPLTQIRAVAAAEFRLARRRVRTWVFAFLAVGGGLLAYHVWSFPATVGATASPRFALPGIGMLSLWMLLVGVVFLAFDMHARDERERIVDVLDTRPVPNIVVLGGRLLAVVAITWLPLVALALLLQVGGLIVEYQNWPVGVPVEPVSLATFMFLDAPSALVFWCALVMLLAAALRNRLAVSLIALSLLAIAFWVLFNTPLYLLPIVSGIANLGLPGSDILPRGPSLVDLLQRVCMFILGAGLVTTAAALLPRRDFRSRTPYLSCGAALLIAGGVGIAGMVVHAVGVRAERIAWADTHAGLENAPRPDLERIEGNVTIDPGRELAIAVHLELRAPDTPLADFLFSLNPAMRVESVQTDGTELAFEHDNGVLRVRPNEPLPPGERAKVSIQARGVPDPRFGYLDSAVWALEETLLGMPIVLQGEQASLFDSRYVALAPAVCWLPRTGANIGDENPVVRPPDFHEIDLTVEIPDGWRAAGPGREVRNGVLRFRPRVALAEFALVAAPFERRALTVDDVEYELLIHPVHLAIVEYFSAEEKLEAVVDYIRPSLRSIPGLHYPHRAMSLVEVPAQLRRYRGGRLLDAVQAWPGVQMLPEHGLPTRRMAARPRYGSPTEDMTLRLDLMYASGGGPHAIPLRGGASRNLLPFLTSASGEGAFAVNYLLQSLTAWRFRSDRTVAPGHWLQLGLAPGSPLPLRVMHRLTGTATFSFNWYLFFPMALEDRSAGFSFTNFDPTASTENADVLIHKGNLIALAVQGLMGREKVAEFLALMRERHAGTTFDLDAFVAAMTETDPAMAPYIEHFMRESTLPGFLAADLRAYRIADDENGQPRYQLAVHIRNDEPVPGVAGISFRSRYAYEWGEFAHVPGNTSLELGVVTREPPEEVRLETYLSQNRRIMRLAVPPIDVETTVREDPFNGSRPSEWLPPDLGIVVDDLDPGFSAESPPRRGLRLSFGKEEGEADDSLPEHYTDAGARIWRRQENPDTVSWGKYRRTLTRIRAGVGEGRASFRAEIPKAGTWRLAYHLPGSSASENNRFQVPPGWESGDRFGVLDFEVVAGESRTPFNFDASTAVSGWNDLGTLDLPAGSVTVVVSDDTTGDIVVADAIRWEPVTADASEPASEAAGS